ncbi:hypothetical protein CYANOKiyG1_80320 [Okeania sp. KiyG1]|nr:hypothetical protein CYANOKiyG1_80320 [Okeania sp. KiyG1]
MTLVPPKFGGLGGQNSVSKNFLTSDFVKHAFFDLNLKPSSDNYIIDLFIEKSKIGVSKN